MVYVGRLVETAYFHAPPEGDLEVREAPLSLLLPIWILIFANLYFGIDTRLTVGVASQASVLLLGAFP
jgi:multicomponent Na+:H+ antiporter subunit D